MHSRRTLPFIQCRAMKPSFVVNISITRGVHTQEGGKTHAGSWIKLHVQMLIVVCCTVGIATTLTAVTMQIIETPTLL